MYETLFGGSRGGGKTDTGLAWLLIDSNNPLYRGLVIRRNATDLEDWIDRARRMYPHAKVVGKPTIIKFPSGAMIRTGHLNDKDAYTHYQGWEASRILIEELTQIPDENSYLKLISSCRSTVEGLEARVFATANPGGRGHAWVKKRFIDGHKPNKPFKDSISGRLRMFIPATVDDNPTLVERDPDYVAYLESLPEPLRSAWRYGDWESFAEGQFFTEFSPQIHVLRNDQAKALGYGRPENRKYIGLDWGYANPFACVWVEVTPDNTVFCYRELYGTEKHPQEWGAEIARLSMHENIDTTLGDPSCWIRNPMSWRDNSVSMYSDKSIAHALQGAGVPNLVPANNARVNGWSNMQQLMSYTGDKVDESGMTIERGTIPRFYILEKSCPNLVRTIPLMLRDEKNPEDLDTTLEDHIVDATRYALSHVIAPDKPKKRVPVLASQLNELIFAEKNETSFTYNFS